MHIYNPDGKVKPFTYRELIVQLHRLKQREWDEPVTLEVDQGDRKVAVKIESFALKGDTVDVPVLLFTDKDD